MILRVLDDADALAAAGAAEITGLLTGRGRLDLGLAGGATPAGTYRALARAAVDWSGVDAWMTDERYVPRDDPECNAAMVRATLADHVPLRLHEVAWNESVHDAAREYELTLAGLLPQGPRGPSPSVVVLGLGEDGHTASLFPECPPPDPSHDFVAVKVPGRGWRMTATYGLLARARHTIFLVAGERKATALAAVLAGDSDLPAARVARTASDARWFVDRAAARLL